MNVDAVSDFLAEQRDQAPDDLQPLFLQFEDLWERKLWHQLTNTLVEFFNHPESAPQRLELYKVFILKFADKINQLKLVDLALKAASQCKGETGAGVPVYPPGAQPRLTAGGGTPLSPCRQPRTPRLHEGGCQEGR